MISNPISQAQFIAFLIYGVFIPPHTTHTSLDWYSRLIHRTSGRRHGKRVILAHPHTVLGYRLQIRRCDFPRRRGLISEYPIPSAIITIISGCLFCVLCAVPEKIMLSVASVACFFTTYSPFQSTDDVVREWCVNTARRAISSKTCSQR